MARRPDRTKEELDELRSVRDLPRDEAQTVLAKALTSKSNLVVARAAELVGELQVEALTTELVSAYQELAGDPFELDKGCLAMKSILGALFALEADSSDVYLHAIRHVQMDSGTFSGDPVDSAAELRGVAAHALIRTEYPSALEEIAPLLVDEVRVRQAAARALRAAGSQGATLLLRMSLIIGERDSEVCYECFAGMLEYSSDSLEYIGSFLRSNDSAVASMAALAIGDLRVPDSFDQLSRAWHTQSNPDVREALLNSIASLRSDEAVDFLVELVTGEAVTALMALEVLSRFRSDSSVVERVRTAAESNKRQPVLSTFETLFADEGRAR